MSSALPIIIAGGALALLSGGKKKKRKKSPSVGDACAAGAHLPNNLVCEDGIVKQHVIDESDLESEDGLSAEDVGDFETREEDVSLSDGEEVAEKSMEMDQQEVDPVDACEEFLRAIYVKPDDPEEIPINKIAAEQTALPAMKAVIKAAADQSGVPVDHELVGPQMVRQALAELVPACEWGYNEAEGEFFHSHNIPLDSEVGKEVLYGLIKMSVQLIDDFNESNKEPQVAYVPVQPKQAQLNVND